jgi:hypothetical protein
MTTPQLITVSEAQQMAREMANSLIADMEAKVTLLQEFAAAMQAELQLIRLGELQFPAAEPSVPVTDRKIPYHALVDAIYLEFSGFTKGRASYKTEEFCDHCRPLLPLGSVDVALDCDGKPLWRRRFFKAHDKIAERRGFKRSARGTWAVPSEGSDG